MADWDHGYVTEVSYTYGYYDELNPVQSALALLNQGYLPPAIEHACELGFGNGVSVNVHAAASAHRWVGTDFNPSQAGFARALAAGAGSGAALYDQSFEEFCGRPDLPNFDFVALHGIWSWVSDANRAVLVDFLRRKLNVGGLVYVSYNTLPGWSPMLSVRHLMREHVGAMSATALALEDRIGASLDFLDKLFATGPRPLGVAPSTQERVKQLRSQPRSYIAHEYLNKDWRPFFYSEFQAAIDGAKLQFACSAECLDHNDTLNLTPEQAGLLARIPDRDVRETVRDYVVNRQFRKDLWIRGPRKLSTFARMEALRSLRLVLVKPAADVTLKPTINGGEASLKESIYGPLLEALGTNRPVSLGVLERSLGAKGISFPQLVEAAVVMKGLGNVAVAQDEAAAERAQAATARLNATILNTTRGTSGLTALASSVTGGGVVATRIDQLFLLARAAGRASAQELAAYTWDLLSSQGERVAKDGKALDTPQDNLAELESKARRFLDSGLPLLQALRVA